MRERQEVIGKKFGRLQVIQMVGQRITARHPKFKCVCNCGNYCIKSEVSLKTGREPSCGCAAKDFQRQKYDLTGQRFGKLLVIRPKESTKKRHITWDCLCDCGNQTTAVGVYLRSGSKQSCGCLRSEIIAEASTKHGHSRAQKASPTYISWASMRTRCLNKNAKNFEHYGGRGISVCERWKHFVNFLNDMGERPEKMSLDRINVNGNYEPSNCRWATASEQVRNRRKQSHGKS